MSEATVSEAERIDWLRLARTEAVGAVTFTHLIDQYVSATRALGAVGELARRAGRPTPPRVPTIAEAQAEIERGAAVGARLIIGRDPEFPRLLAVLDPPPPLIWTIGEPGLLARKTVAIVGARSASAAGQRFARTLAGALGETGYVVVSGMARGVDAAAHWGALATGTVAVIAGGVDTIYPPENGQLREAIAASGCLVSERMIGHEARAQDFPRRNRLISGLSLGVIVVEAELRSGSLITARLAGEQGREVFAVPGSPLDPRARGANDLIRQGATLVEEVEDVLRVLDSRTGVAAPSPPRFETTPDTGDLETDELRAMLTVLLSPTPTPIDELTRATGAPTPLVLAALMELSLAGQAELLPGGLAVVQ